MPKRETCRLFVCSYAVVNPVIQYPLVWVGYYFQSHVAITYSSPNQLFRF